MGSLLASTAATPGWLWFATRGLGMTTLLVLTATVVLGIMTSGRAGSARFPRFVSAELHRSLSLIAIGLLLGHIATTLFDPFAHMNIAEVVVPGAARYRPFWIGLGVGAAEVLIAVSATSLLRAHIGSRAWRLIHWSAYGSWPMALVHGLGAGSDARAPWAVAAVAACVCAVLFALVLRLSGGRLVTFPIRIAISSFAGALLAAGMAWAFSGPFASDWPARAGTTALSGPTPAPRPAHDRPGGFRDELAGRAVRDASGYTQIAMRDQVDTALTVVIRSPDAGETLPVVTVARDGRVVCTAPATVTKTLYAVCNQTRLTISLAGPSTVSRVGGPVTGELTTSGPLD